MTEIDDLDDCDHPWRFSPRLGWVVLLKYSRDLPARVIGSRDWDDLGDLPSGGDTLPFFTPCRSHLRNLERFNRDKFDSDVAYLKQRIAQFESLKDGLIRAHRERELRDHAAIERRHEAAEVARSEADVLRNVWTAAAKVGRYAHQPSPSLDDTDWLLVRDWAGTGRGEDDFRFGAMASARRAELAALRVYRRLYGDAEDLSVLQQLRPTDLRWRCAD